MTNHRPTLWLPDRRNVLKGMAATGLALAAPMPALAEPSRGGRLRIGWYSTSATDTLNPVKLTSAYDWFRSQLVTNTLVRYDRDMALLPDLAVSWETDDATVWTFRLRDGVEFHNGKTLDAADVVYSLNLHRGESSESAIRAWLGEVSDIAAVDPLTVRITLNSPDVDLPRLLGWPSTAIVPAGYEDLENAVGTGPFRLTSFEPGVAMRAQRFENYFLDGKPYVDEVETIGIPDTNARLNALMAGDVDYIAGVDPKVVDLIERAPGISVAAATGSQHFTFPMRTEAAPFGDVRVRQALRHLADREAMLANVLKGFGSLGNDHPIAPSDPLYCADIPQRAYDPERARFLLGEAGFSGPLVLHTSDAAGGSIAPDLALLLRESAAAAGVEIEVRREPSDGYWSAVWNKQPFAMSNWLPRPTANMILSQIYLSGARWNEANLRNPRFDELVTGVRSVTDEAVRAEMYCDIQRILYEEGASIIPLFTNWIDAKGDRLQGWQGHPFGPAEGYRLAESVWLA